MNNPRLSNEEIIYYLSSPKGIIGRVVADAGGDQMAKWILALLDEEVAIYKGAENTPAHYFLYWFRAMIGRKLKELADKEAVEGEAHQPKPCQ